MLKTRKLSDAYGMPVYTDEGYYYGDVEEVIIQGNRVYGWKVKATKHSQLSRVLTGAKGATIPHNLIKSLGDIMLISKSALPEGDEDSSSSEDF